MIRYYGIYTSRNKRKKLIKFFRDGYDRIRRKIENWRLRIMKTYGYDPIKCDKCGKEMDLTDIYYKKYGSVLEFFENKMLEEAKKEISKLEEKVKITNYIYKKGLNIYYD